METALDRALSTTLPLLPQALREPVEAAVTSGGKRLRPILCMAAYEACQGPRGPDVADLAVSLEFIHAYSLMHDDLPCMDDAPLRRGRPTPHITYGERSATLGGAALIPVAHVLAWRSARGMGHSPEEARGMVACIARAAGGAGMVGGQGLDLLGEDRVLDQSDLDQLHGLKTGALLTASLELGALAARAPLARREALVTFGQAIGLAFQIADDVLDATADQDRLGKAPSDQDLSKSTYVSLLGVDASRARARSLVDQGIEELARTGVDTPPLVELARYVVDRDR